MSASSWVAIIIAFIGAAGGIGLGIAAVRKVRPESQKLILEGRSTWTLAETNYFDKLADRQDREAAGMRVELERLRRRIEVLERSEEELEVAKRTNADLAEQLEEALARAVHAEQRAEVAEARVAACERRIAALEAQLRERG